MKLAIVTASIDPEKTREYWQSWREKGQTDAEYIMVYQGNGIIEGDRADWDLVLAHQGLLGVVPAFRLGVEIA